MTAVRGFLTWAVASWLLAATAFALIQLARGVEPAVAWLGLGLAAAPPLAWMLFERLRVRYRQARPPLAISLMSGLGLAIAMTLAWRYEGAAGWAHLWAGISLIAWVAYLRWIR